MFTRQSWAPLHQILAITLLTLFLPVSALAVTETVIHSFGTAGTDGQKPFAGLTEHGGVFYGTTHGGGPHLVGTVYALKLVNGVWREKVLYAFTGGADGDEPTSQVIFDSAGNLYGTTYYGGTDNCFGSLGCGTVFQLSPKNGTWTETVIHNFTGTNGGADGENPSGGLVLDAAGNLYGSTTMGGANNAGTVFKVTPSGGTWVETVLYSFIANRMEPDPWAA